MRNHQVNPSLKSPKFHLLKLWKLVSDIEIVNSFKWASNILIIKSCMQRQKRKKKTQVK